MSKEIEILKRRLEREKAARKQAETILEAKAKELYEVNQSLEVQVKERTAALEKSEQQYRSIVENAEDIIYNIDANGNFSFVNPAGLLTTGYSSEEILGKSFYNVIRQDYRGKVQNFYYDVLVNHKQKTYNEFPILRKDGTTIWIGQNVKLNKDDKGQISFSVLARDITQRKILSQELEKAKLIAENAQMAEAEFLANMSHEMRTPLNAIIGMSHLLQDANLNDAEEEYLEILSSSADVLQRLISDVLDISKIDAGKLELQHKPFDLLKLIKNLERTFAIKLEQKEVEISTHSNINLQKLVIGDELIINQIFLNLLSNAEKFTEKGEIIIHINQLKKTTKTIALELAVSDTGIGMSENQIQQIFEQFKQASSEIRKNYGGTGLGLAITKKLIELINSEIKVESTEKQGTTFSFELSLELSDIPIGKEEEIYRKKLEFSTIEDPVLIVEDNKMNQKYITRLFEKWKLKYHLANNGKEAVDLSKKHHYCMIFMDLQMPVMDGYEATHSIRNEKNLNTDTPIVALTASTLLSKKQHALNSGMTDFLSKPYNPKQLSKIILIHLKIDDHYESTENLEKKFQFNASLDGKYLKENYGDDLEYCLDIMETFLETVPIELDALKESKKQKDFQQFAKTAHKLKPTFTMVGFPKLSEEFQTLELDAKIESEDAFKRLPKIKNDIENLMNIISEQRTKLQDFLKK